MQSQPNDERERLLALNRARVRTYYQRHREKELARKRAYRAANPEKAQEWAKAYQRDPEKTRAHNDAYYQRNRGKIRAQQKTWRKANRAKIKELHRAYIPGWRDRNREKIRRYSFQRRARLYSVGGTIFERDAERLFNRYDGMCAYCRIQPATELDHVVPIARGGQNTIGNVLPACGSCNRTKAKRLLVEWRQRPAS